MTVQGERPDPDEMIAPWVTVDCAAGGAESHWLCMKCDGLGWHYQNPDTGDTVSEMMRDALERHG